MKIGAHVSAAGGAANAAVNAHTGGFETFQFFSRPPQGGPAPKLTAQGIRAFKTACKKYGFTDTYIHTPYFINFASTTPRIRYGSIGVVREDLERGSLFGVTAVMTHLGSARDAGPKLGVHKTWRALQRILDGYRGTTQLLIEMSAGSGEIIGDTFEEIATIIRFAERGKPYRGQIGVCFDTCHAFASGYDLRTKAAVAKTLAHFHRTIGFTRLKLFHANDSLGGLGEHKDRHAHIGKGQIGLEGFRTFLHNPKLAKRNFILETPFDGERVDDFRTLRQLRGSR